MKGERPLPDALRKSRVFNSWKCMRLRCNNPKMYSYPWYGGKGIKVCERWNDFWNFLDDMGHPPDGHTLDRIDSAGNYEPSNCRWASVTEQNRRKALTRTHNVCGYRGLKKTSDGTFGVYIGSSKKALYLGSFKTAEEAAAKYNEVAIKIHGAKAILNVIPSTGADAP